MFNKHNVNLRKCLIRNVYIQISIPLEVSLVYVYMYNSVLCHCSTSNISKCVYISVSFIVTRINVCIIVEWSAIQNSIFTLAFCLHFKCILDKLTCAFTALCIKRVLKTICEEEENVESERKVVYYKYNSEFNCILLYDFKDNIKLHTIENIYDNF